MRVLRRAVSTAFYLFAGMCLMCWAMMAFVGREPNLPKVPAMGFMAVFALAPLAIGALISPGYRLREVGIVMLVAAGWIAFGAIALGIALSDSRLMALMPPDTRQSFLVFDDLVFGASFTISMAAIGLWLINRKGRSTP